MAADLQSFHLSKEHTMLGNKYAVLKSENEEYFAFCCFILSAKRFMGFYIATVMGQVFMTIMTEQLTLFFLAYLRIKLDLLCSA